MYPDELVFGLLNTSNRINDSLLCEKFRSFTISWSRYGYRGRFIEENSANAILDRALELGYRWCLIQAYGHVISERWSPRQNDSQPLERVLTQWLSARPFFAAGHLLGNAKDGYGVDDEFMLVDLHSYVAFGKPAYELLVSEPIACIQPTVEFNASSGYPVTATLVPSSQVEWRNPQMRGWNFVEASLRHGMPVYGFEPETQRNSINLNAPTQELAHFARFLDNGILAYERARDCAELTEPQQAFLESVQRSVKNSKQGVFLWNLESYEDVQTPPSDFRAPVSTIYSVAAGFKPNVILESLGFGDETRVVYFDYSPDALKVKQLLVKEWDGEDFPAFVKYLFRVLPYPQTFYYLWSGFNPQTVPAQELDEFWELELQKWGGAARFKEHWARYRNLRHEYIVCNILSQASLLHEQMRRESSAVIWWSNAFFTVYSNWFLTVNERQGIYNRWIQGLAARNPELFLYGSDYTNISVNHIQARAYLEQYETGGTDYLNPLNLNKVRIRF